MPIMSVSWNASRPIMGRDTWPVIATTGELSMCAAASPVTRFVAPGPDVATHTPTRPRAPVGRVGRRLLVPHQDVPQAGVVRQRMIERHDGAAGIAEDHFDPGIHQRPAQDLRAREHLAHRLTLPRSSWR